MSIRGSADRLWRYIPGSRGFDTSGIEGEKTMRFMMIVKADPSFEAGRPPNPALLAAVGKLSEEMTKDGVLLQSGGLQPSSKGARVRVSGGKMTVTDGPFAETKELVGGFAILEAASKEEAIRLGKEFMQLHVDVLGQSYEGTLEVRPMFDPASADCS
jgi:hypothetical protein